MSTLYAPEVVPAPARGWTVVRGGMDERGAELVAVTVYRKGAQSVAAELKKIEDYENQTIPHSNTRLVPAA